MPQSVPVARAVQAAAHGGSSVAHVVTRPTTRTSLAGDTREVFLSVQIATDRPATIVMSTTHEPIATV